jgi:hypothetical protein
MNEAYIIYVHAAQVGVALCAITHWLLQRKCNNLYGAMETLNSEINEAYGTHPEYFRSDHNLWPMMEQGILLRDEIESAVDMFPQFMIDVAEKRSK